MTRDPRTPRTYFKSKEKHQVSDQELNAELQDVLEVLVALRNNPKFSNATKEIALGDLKRVEKKVYKNQSKKNAVKIMNAIEDGTVDGIVEALSDALLYKIHHRIEPQLVESGMEIEERLFWLNQYGHK